MNRRSNWFRSTNTVSSPARINAITSKNVNLLSTTLDTSPVK